jgi:hypothetical protein
VGEGGAGAKRSEEVVHGACGLIAPCNADARGSRRSVLTNEPRKWGEAGASKRRIKG